MADDYKASGYAFLGVKKKDFPLYRDFASEMSSVLDSNKESLKEQGFLSSRLLGYKKDEVTLASVLTKNGKLQKNLSKDELKAAQDGLSAQAKKRDAIQEMFPGAVGIAKGIDQTLMSFQAMLGPIGIAVGIFALLVKFAFGFAKEIAQTRKDLGVSAVTAGKLVIANKALGMQAKLYGLEIDDVKEAQGVILNDLGGSVKEAVALGVNLARTAAATGQSSASLGKTLSIMESISTASRDVLLNQIRANAAMVEAAGVAPGRVMRDIADNAEFFATFAKDGGDNLFAASAQALKLGTSLSGVADTARSLLDFESSIEKQMEASVLLGRQLNLDRARQLAFTGDIEGLQKEILKQVGSEAEFNQMNFAQREALAGALGRSVEDLARIVRGGSARASVEQTKSMMSDFERTQAKFSEESNGFLKNIERSTAKTAAAMFE